MNRERLRVLADILRAPRPLPQNVDFNMNWGIEPAETMNFPHRNGQPVTSDDATDPNWCGTVCCIGGLAALLWAPEAIMRYSDGTPLGLNASLVNIGQDVLGLDANTSYPLFYPEGSRDIDYDKITREQAAETIEGLLDGNGVSWEHVVEAQHEDA